MKVEPFENKIVNVIKWLPASETLEDLPEKEIDRIRNAGECFFTEYGYWTAFGLAIGIKDRAPRQFVYSARDNKLAMIDMDYCFDSMDDFKKPLMPFQKIPEEKLNVYMKNFASGFDHAAQALESNKNDIHLLLKSARFSSAAKSWQVTLKEGIRDKAIEDIQAYLG